MRLVAKRLDEDRDVERTLGEVELADRAAEPLADGREVPKRYPRRRAGTLDKALSEANTRRNP